MQKYNKSLFLILSVLTLPIVCANQASAIPAFSREHNTECTTCHTIYPELNEYGEAFLKNGYVWTKNLNTMKEAAPAAKPVAAKPEVKGEGDPDLLEQLKATALTPEAGDGLDAEAPKQVKKNEPLWLSGVPEKLPLSLSATLNLAYNKDAADKDKYDLATRALSLLSGGVFRDKVSFWIKYNLYTQGAFDPAASNTPLNTTAGSGPNAAPDIEEVFFMYRKAFDTPVNLKVGRFRPKLSLWKKSNKTTVSDFATNTYRADASKFTLDAPEDGLEANAIFANRLFVAAGIVDRNGQNAKEGYGHISYKFGGSDLAGKEPEVDLDSEHLMDYLSITVAGYGYFGKNSGDSSIERNKFYRVGGDLDVLYKSVRCRLTGVVGKDDNPDFGSNLTTKSYVMAAQAEYMLQVNMLALLRYEYQDVGYSGVIVHRYIPALAYAPIENTKITLEYQYQKAANQSVAANDATDQKLLLGLRFTF